MSVTKKELAIIAMLALFALVWTIIVMPQFSEWIWFQNQTPLVQFAMFEIGYIIFFVALIGVPVSYLVSGRKKAVDIWAASKIGLSAWASVGLLYDLWEPPFFLDTQGQILLNNPKAMTGTAVDAMLAWVFQQIGVHGSLLYYSVYVIFPVIVITILAIAFTWKRFVKMIGGF